VGRELDRVELRVEFLLKVLDSARKRWSEYAKAVFAGGGKGLARGFRIAGNRMEAVVLYSVLYIDIAVVDWALECERAALYLHESIVREEPEPLSLAERILKWVEGEGEDCGRFLEMLKQLEASG
jgi:hypothetical protein